MYQDWKSSRIVIVLLIEPFVWWRSRRQARRGLLRPRPHVTGCFWIRNFFFPDSEISPSTRSVFKSNSPVHTHPMLSRFTRETRPTRSAVILGYCSVRDLTRVCYVIGFENIRIHHPIHTLSDSLRIYFFYPLESGFKSIRIRCRIRRYVWMRPKTTYILYIHHFIYPLNSE